MKDIVYLTINRGGVVSMRKTPPALSAGQYAVRLSVTVDDRFFRQAIPTATLTIGEDHLIHPEIDVQLDPPPEAPA